MFNGILGRDKEDKPSKRKKKDKDKKDESNLPDKIIKVDEGDEKLVEAREAFNDLLQERLELGTWVLERYRDLEDQIETIEEKEQKVSDTADEVKQKYAPEGYDYMLKFGGEMDNAVLIRDDGEDEEEDEFKEQQDQVVPDKGD